MSSRAFRKGHILQAKVLKLLNYLVFRCILPYECELIGGVVLWHRGLGTVIHPAIKIGNNVQIAHAVTIAGSGKGQSEIGNDVIVAAHAVIIPKNRAPFRIGDRAVIGAGAVIVGDVPPDAVMIGNPARNVNDLDASSPHLTPPI